MDINGLIHSSRSVTQREDKQVSHGVRNQDTFIQDQYLVLNKDCVFGQETQRWDSDLWARPRERDEVPLGSKCQSMLLNHKIQSTQVTDCQVPKVVLRCKIYFQPGFDWSQKPWWTGQLKVRRVKRGALGNIKAGKLRQGNRFELSLLCDFPYSVRAHEKEVATRVAHVEF